MKFLRMFFITMFLGFITFSNGNDNVFKDTDVIEKYPKFIQNQVDTFNEYLFGTIVKRGYPIGSNESIRWERKDILKIDKLMEEEFLKDPRGSFEKYYKLYDYLIKHVIDKNDFYTLLSIYLDSIENIKYINSRGEYIHKGNEHKGFVSMFYELHKNREYTPTTNQEVLSVEENLLNLKIRMSKFFYRRGKEFTDTFKEYSLKILNENPTYFSRNIVSKFNNSEYESNIYESLQKKLVKKYYKSEIKNLPKINITKINDLYHVETKSIGDEFSNVEIWQIVSSNNKEIIYDEKKVNKDYKKKGIYRISIDQDDKSLLINEWTGGAHCCYSSRIFKKNEDKTIVFQDFFNTGECAVRLDEKYIKSCDDTYDYFLTSFAGTPMPELVFDRDLNLLIEEMKKLNDIEYDKALKDSIEDDTYLSMDDIQFAYNQIYNKKSIKGSITPYFSESLYSNIVYYIYNGNLELAKKLYNEYNKFKQLELKNKDFSIKDNDFVLELILKKLELSPYKHTLYEYYNSKNISFDFKNMNISERKNYKTFK